MRFVSKIGIVTLFASFFLMSHNASAATVTYNLNDYNTVHFYPQVKVACQFTDVNNAQVSYPTNVDACGYGTISRGDVWKLRRFYSYNSCPVESGDIVEFYVLARSPNDSSTWSFNPGAIDTGSNLYYMMDYQQMATNNFDIDSVYYSIFRFTFKVLSTGNWNFGFINANDYFIYQGKVDFSIFNISVYRKKTENDINKEQADATQEAANNSNTTAQGNSSNGQTTNLIGVFQNFVSALTNLSATNCNVTLAWPSSLGGNMTVNICRNKDYGGNIISVFGSLTLIVFYIPFSLKMLSMIYNEIRSFTNG